VRLTIGTHGRRCSATCSIVERKPWDGTPMTMRSALPTASDMEVVARRSACNVTSGRYRLFWRRCSMSSATVTSRDHSVVGVLAATRFATVVPQDPAPITATRISMGRLYARGWMSALTGVLVPVKSFTEAKVRLAPALDNPARAALARQMAAIVVAAAAPLPVAVVCDDESVSEWASSVGAEVFWRPERGLNGAVADGVSRFGERGFDRVIVAHADLPLADDLTWVADLDGVTLVPDRRDDGTNVICVPTRVGFEFSYGPGSFQRHLAEAQRLGLPHRVVREPRLGWDVDVPGDLEIPVALTERPL
jgi:2-phospho-L-lactate guanylyltransferase